MQILKNKKRQIEISDKTIIFDVDWKNFGSTKILQNEFIIKELQESINVRLIKVRLETI